MELTNLSSNWKKLQSQLQKEKTPTDSQQASDKPLSTSRKRKAVSSAPFTSTSKKIKHGHPLKMESKDSAESHQLSSENAQGIIRSIAGKGQDAPKTTRPLTATDRENEGLAESVEVGKYIAIDCEMVGVGPNPSFDSALARVSAVNYNGDQVYDSYVRPKELVTDFRTHVSGIQAKHLATARSLEEVQKDVAKLLEGRILVGHAVGHDLRALLLSHPKRDIRDTSKHQPFRKLAGGGTPKLKILASELLGVTIQSGEHSSVEDARATMLIFRREKDAFDTEHARYWRPQQEPQATSIQPNSTSTRKPKKKKKKKSKRT